MAKRRRVVPESPYSLYTEFQQDMIDTGIQNDAGYEAIIMATIMRSLHPMIGKDANFQQVAREIGYNFDQHFSELVFLCEVYKFWVQQPIHFTWKSHGINRVTMEWINRQVVETMIELRVEIKATPSHDALVAILAAGLTEIFYRDYQVETSYHRCSGPQMSKDSIEYTLDRVSLGRLQEENDHLILGEVKWFTFKDYDFRLIQYATCVSAAVLAQHSNRVSLSAEDPHLCYCPICNEVVEQNVILVNNMVTKKFQVVLPNHPELEAFKQLHLLQNQVFQKIKWTAKLLKSIKHGADELKQEFYAINHDRKYLSRLEREQLMELMSQLKEISTRCYEQISVEVPEAKTMVNLERDGEVSPEIAGFIRDSMMRGPGH